MCQLIAPIAPFCAEKAWECLGNKGSVHETGWPSFDPSSIEDESVMIVCQINGTVREKLQLPKNLSKDEIEKHARRNDKVNKYLSQGEVKKMIIVPNKLINFVLV